jgi:hypothetical protein
MRVAMRCIAVLAFSIGALWPVSVAQADQTYTGTVLGCSYTLAADTTADTFSATVAQCHSSLDPAGEIDGSWITGAGQTTVSLDTAKLTVLGQEQDFTPGFTLTLPFDLNAAVDQAQAFKQIVSRFEADLVLIAGSAASVQAGSGVQSALKAFNDLNDPLDSGCQATGTNGTNPFCSPYGPNSTPGNVVPARANDGAVGAGDNAENSDAAQFALCPPINASQHDAVFVCVPSYVTGDLDVGRKPLVILGGGALFMIPSPTTGKSTISSSTAVVGLGGAIVGYQTTVKAPAIELAGGFAAAIQGLQLAGTDISIGSVDGARLLAAIPNLPRDWHSEITSQIHTQIKAPEVVGGSSVTITAKSALDLSAGSTIDTSGRGSHGGDFDTGFNATGESNGYGGSHGGLGGPTTYYIGGDFFDYWYTKQGRSPTFDSPFAPSRPGDGGGGSAGAELGLPGGGVVRIDAHAAKVSLGGKIDVTGINTGDPLGNGDHGGAGAGGSVYITSGPFSGGGEINADGGSNCHSCVNGFGGGGGGGRIAVLSTSFRNWRGRLHALGGRDQTYRGPPPATPGTQPFLGSGGTGTVFTRAVKFSKTGQASPAARNFHDGTLTIDGGRGPASFPPPDGTPLLNAWSSPKRHLVITGQARVYGRTVRFKQIDVSRGATLTTGIDGTTNAIPNKLSVTAGQLGVDRTSRITMTGRGLEGGSSQSSSGAGGAVHGQTASTLGHGGSHGGAGGSAVDSTGHSGSTYDSMHAPSQPGGGGAGIPGTSDGSPGGGVLDINVGTLVLAGVIAADGESGDGPTAAEPAPHDFAAGAGAGGSLNVHVKTLIGSGALSALGGTSCVSVHPPLLRGIPGCGLPVGNNGGGGGGRLALIATDTCSWHGIVSAAGGVDLQAEQKDHPHAHALRGTAGTVYLPSPLGQTCQNH